MTETEIRYFLAVYRNRNITKAAEELIVTRPVVSRALAKIEKEIGVKLFDRKVGGLVPTEQGTLLFNMFDSFVKTYKLTLERLKNPNLLVESRSLCIGMMNAGSGWLYPLIYRRFHQKYPNIVLKVEGINPLEAEQLLYDGTLDMAISPLMADYSSDLLGLHYLYSTHWVLCSPVNSTKPGTVREKESGKIEVSMIKDLSVAILETLPPPFYPYKEIVLSTKDPEMVKIAVTGGYAHAILPLELCAQWEGVINRQFIPSYDPHIYLLWNKSVPHSPAFESFLSFLKKIDFARLDMPGVFLRPELKSQA